MEVPLSNQMDEQDSALQRQMSGQKPSRELKVEDALLYLDQVKMEFSDKPHIYNEFLDIMKNFKAQSINTPGVIERVKNLFKGYNKLILGFNTFLPEGEGYKIELTPEEQAFSHPGQELPSGYGGSSISSMTSGNMTDGGATSNEPSRLAISVPSTMPAAFPAGPPTPSGAGTGTPNSAKEKEANNPISQMQQQAHAIHYVTKIRNRFSNEPETYRAFLKILHTYQKEQKGIKEVLEQVSSLFADHPDLLIEFTYFLPDAVQEQAKERLHRAAKDSELRRQARLQAVKQSKKQMAAADRVAAQGGAGILYGAHLRPMGGNFAVDPVTGRPLNSLMPISMDITEIGAPSALPPKDSLTGNKRAREQRLYAQQQAQGFPMQGGQMGGPSMGIAGWGEAPQRKNMAYQQQGGQAPRKNARRMPRATGNHNIINETGVTDSYYSMGNETSQDPYARVKPEYPAPRPSRSRGKDTHVSISAERRFFDQVRDALMNLSRETWVEFVKILELFANDAMTKDDLLVTVQDLFGPGNQELYAEFVRLMDNRADYEANKEDLWYAIPLSEIDFSQCRKCTPSYRALPKDYPKPKCTERSEEEQQVLNDQWVSIPIGSEESYSFKHMRKNQFEEALFRCEDERFEIDMVIDSNMSTIRMLEPLAEEIANMAKMEQFYQQRQMAHQAVHGGAANGHVAGMHHMLPRFQFQLDRRNLSVIHINAIARIYGEHGDEILELLRKNPMGAVPILLKRLKQKDLEWRQARAELNKNWKEVIEKNHFKSFDHRSFYFRQQDKKYLSTRQLVNDIVGQPFLVNANGTPVAEADALAALTASEDAQQSGISPTLNKEHVTLLAGMTPQLLLNYENDAQIVHKDIYEIICHAVETTITTAYDRERVLSLWRDLLRVIYNIPVHFLYSPSGLKPAVSASNGSNGSGNAMDVSTTKAVPLHTDKSEAWLPNTKVFTQYGSGTVKEYRAKDGIYVVQLPFGIGYLSPNMIHGAEQLSAAALNVIGVSQEAGKKDKIFNGQVVNEAPPASIATVQEPCKLFFGTQMCYIFMRLHHALYVRLRMARKLALEMMTAPQERMSNPLLRSVSMEEFDIQHAMHNFKSISGGSGHHSIYNYFLSQLVSVVDGTIDNNKFEDICRTALGNKSYMLYTIDKIIVQTMKHLQAMATDENVCKLIGLFVYHRSHDTPTTAVVGKGIDPWLYQQHVGCILSHTMEDVFRIQVLTTHAGNIDGQTQVAIQHLGILLANNQQIPASSQGESAVTDVATDAAAPHARKATIDESSLTINTSAELTAMNLNRNRSNSAISIAGRTPKAVVSDGEEDDTSSSDDESTNKASIEEEIENRKVMFSPRSRLLSGSYDRDEK